MTAPSWPRRAAHLLEGLGATALYAVFRLLPLAAASALGGFLGRGIGPRLAVSRRALKSLRRAIPEIDEEEGRRVVRDMWDNLGRVIAEYPHLRRLRAEVGKGRIEIVGAERLPAPDAPGPRTIFFSGHFGNWEISSIPMTHAGLPIAAIYRAANNPLVDQLLNHARAVLGVELSPKGTRGARRMLAAMQEGRHVAMLVDQKMNDGIAVPFFGRDAMTAPALAALALRYDCAVVPVRIDRIGGARFRITVEPALDLALSGDAAADTLAIMTQVNQALERWIRDRPDLWFWLHRRWPD